jgi:hypothetical protein
VDFLLEMIWYIQWKGSIEFCAYSSFSIEFELNSSNIFILMQYSSKIVPNAIVRLMILTINRTVSVKVESLLLMYQTINKTNGNIFILTLIIQFFFICSISDKV